MRNIYIGFLLGFRQIQRANFWTTSLIIFVMMLTFLNLIAVSGILVGLIEGAERAVRAESLGDIILSERDDEDVVWGSMVKQTLKRRKPGFNERYHGFGSFGALLEEMGERQLLNLQHDERSGGYIVTGYQPAD